MSLAKASLKADPVSLWPRLSSLKGLLPFLGLIAFGLLIARLSAPPSPVAPTAPETAFSSGRALAHLRAIAQTARPVGSAAHAAARQYILQELAAQGINPIVQKATVIDQDQGVPFTAAAVENILGRLPGTQSGKAILLASHYDSVPTGPGASDDGAAVSAMLETLRALKAGEPLRNDVIFLFTDAEENGLLGARAFVQEHPWAKDVAVVFNFEARGNAGPAVMFETSADNGWLVEQLAKAAPRPIANSYAYEIYKRLPNDSDLSVFKRAGFAGMNFAFIGGLNHYHSVRDDLDSLDEGSLQHHGSYALALARHFGGLDLTATRAPDAIFFDLGGALLVRYPQSWALPLAALVMALVLAVVGLGIKRRQLAFAPLAWGALYFASALLATPTVVAGVWWIISQVHGEYSLFPQGDTYNSHIYTAAFIALALASVAFLFAGFQRRSDAPNLLAGALVVGAALLLILAVNVPGASYLLSWPLLFGALALSLSPKLRRDAAVPLKWSAAVLALSLPALVLFSPVIYLTFLATGLNWAAVPMALAATMFGLLVPQVWLVVRTGRWLVPVAALLVALVFFIGGSATARFDKEHPRPNSLFYSVNVDSGKAVWVSGDKSPDEWTSQYLKGPVTTGPAPGFVPSAYPGLVRSEAPVIQVAPPEIALAGETISDAGRTLQLVVRSPRQAPTLFLAVDPNTEVVAAAYEGQPLAIEPTGRFLMRCFAVPKEGARLALTMRAGQPLRIRAIDMSSGLPEIPNVAANPRPRGFIPAAFPFNDSTLVSKMFAF